MRWAVLASWLVMPALARAQQAAAARVHVEAEGKCPSAAQLEAALSPLLGPGRVALDGDAVGASGPVQARVSDDGERYTIAIRTLRRELEDRARDCVERARVAAVLIALNLGEEQSEPSTQAAPAAPTNGTGPTRTARTQPAPKQVDRDPDDDEEADEDQLVEEEPPEPEEPPRPPEPFTIGMQLLGSGELATAIERAAFGGSVGVWVRDAGFGVALDAGLLSPVMLELQPSTSTRARAALMRVPITFSVQYLFRVGGFRFGPALGMGIDVLRVAGEDVERAQTAVRASFGGFAALEARALLNAELEAVLRLHVRAFPKAYSLAVPPDGALGETPKLWAGASLGLAWRFR